MRDRAAFDPAGRDDLPRHAANQADEMGVVDVQVDGRAAGLVDVADGGRPIGPRNHPLELPAEQCSISARFRPHRRETRTRERTAAPARP